MGPGVVAAAAAAALAAAVAGAFYAIRRAAEYLAGMPRRRLRGARCAAP